MFSTTTPEMLHRPICGRTICWHVQSSFICSVAVEARAETQFSHRMPHPCNLIVLCFVRKPAYEFALSSLSVSVGTQAYGSVLPENFKLYIIS